jgi:hypothetical protein
MTDPYDPNPPSNTRSLLKILGWALLAIVLGILALMLE